MATIKLNVTSGGYTIKLSLDNVYFDDDKTVTLDLTLPVDYYHGVSTLNNKVADDLPDLETLPEIVEEKSNVPVRPISSVRRLDIVNPYVITGTGLGEGTGDFISIKGPNAIQLGEFDTGTFKNPDESKQQSNPDESKQQSNPDESKVPVQQASTMPDEIKSLRDEYMAQAGNPSRGKVPIDVFMQHLSYQANSPLDIENRTMYKETFSALDDWLRTMMNVQDDGIASFVKSLDKEFGKNLLKMSVTLDDATFTGMIELMGTPIRAQGVTENANRLKTIMIGFRRHLLGDVLNSVDTPGCSCEYCIN